MSPSMNVDLLAGRQAGQPVRVRGVRAKEALVFVHLPCFACGGYLMACGTVGGQELDVCMLQVDEVVGLFVTGTRGRAIAP